MENELTKEEKTKSFLDRCVLLLDDIYEVSYDKRFWEE